MPRTHYSIFDRFSFETSWQCWALVDQFCVAIASTIPKINKKYKKKKTKINRDG
jgi:hypothetical protein